MNALLLALSVDLLVVGGTTNGVDRAIRACEEGQRVMLVTQFPYLGEDVAGTLELGYGEKPPTPEERLRWQLWTNETAFADYAYATVPAKSTESGTKYTNDWGERFAVEAEPVNMEDIGVFSNDVVTFTARLEKPTAVARLEVLAVQSVEGATDYGTESVGYAPLDGQSRAIGVTNLLSGVWNGKTLKNEEGNKEIPLWEFSADLSEAGPVSNVLIVLRKKAGAKNQSLSRVWFRLPEPETSLSAPTPLKVKATLDRLTAESGVEVLVATAVKSYEADRSGRIRRVTLASRSGETSVTAKKVVDDTRYGMLALMAGGGSARVGTTERFSRVLIASGSLSENLATLRARGLEVEQAGSVSLHGSDYPAIRAWADLPMADGTFASFAAAEMRMRELTTLYNLRDDADLLVWHRRTDAAEAGEMPAATNFDVVVVGGGTAGTPAGIAAARSGAKALVVEYGGMLGGVGTDGMLSGYYDGNPCGFNLELDAKKAEVARADNPKRVRYSPYLRSESWRRMCEEAGTTVWLNSFGIGAVREGDRVVGVIVGTEFGPQRVLAKCVVDATGNSDIAAAAGAETELILPRELALQSAGLSPHRLSMGSVNSDFGYLDDGDTQDLRLFLWRGRAGAPRRPWDIAKLPNSRERRRIVPVYRFTGCDVAGHRTFPDTVVQAFSRLDIHGFISGDFIYVGENCGTINPAVSTNPQFSSNLPLRSTLPRGLKGISVVGLGVGVDRDILPVVRMQRDFINLGYSVGVAAAMAARTDGDFGAIDLNELKAVLVAKGILRDEVLEWTEDTDESSDGRIAEAVTAMADGYHLSHVLWREENRARAVPLLREAYRGSDSELKRQMYAKMLGFLGDATGEDTLLPVATNRWASSGLRSRERDKATGGYLNLGTSMGDLRLGFIRALGLSGSTKAPAALAKYLTDDIGTNATLANLRAVTLALTALGDGVAADALAAKLRTDGFHGFYRADESELPPLGGYGPSTEHSDALKELSLVRALYACGDRDGLAQETLEAYARDPRRHLANYAVKVLETYGGSSAVTNLSGRTAEVGRIDGRFCVFGDASGTIVVGTLGEGAVLDVRGGVNVRVLAASEGATVEFHDGDEWRLSGPYSGDPASVTVILPHAGGTLALGGRLDFSQGLADCAVVRLETGSDIKLPDGVTAAISGSGTVQMPNWKDKPYFWADAMKRESITLLGEHWDLTAATNRSSAVAWLDDEHPGYPLVWEWSDCRGAGAGYALRSLRCSSFAEYDTMKSDPRPTYPFLATNAVVSGEAVGFVSFAGANPGGRQARLVEYDGEKDSWELCDRATGFAIVVFGSQQGGGAGILGSKRAVLGREYSKNRAAAANAMFTNRNFTVFADGAKVADSTVTGLSGGWQILSINTARVPVHGLGFDKCSGSYATSSNLRGYSNYAEVMLFGEVPTTVERKQAEEYLSAKWELPIAHSGTLASRSLTLSPGTLPGFAPVVSFGDGDVPVSLTVNLDFCGEPRSGIYPLVQGANVKAWRLGEVTLAGGDPPDARIRLTYDEDSHTVCAEVRRGSAFTIR